MEQVGTKKTPGHIHHGNTASTEQVETKETPGYIYNWEHIWCRAGGTRKSVQDPA